MEILDLRLPHEIIHKYPYPLAIAAARVNDSTEDVEKFLALARLAEITLKYLAVLSMAQYLADLDWDEQIQSELQKLPRPSLGVWNSILSTCMAFYGSKNRVRPFCLPELRDGYVARLGQESPAGQSMLEWTRFVTEYLDGKPGGRQSVSVKEVLELIVRYRNKTWGHGIPQLTSDFCAEHGVKLAAGLKGLLRAMDYLCRYPLRYIKEVRRVKGQDVHIMFDYMGTMGRQGTTYTGEYTQETRLYVCDQGGKPRLCLSPLFVLRERRVYVLDYYEAEPGQQQAGYCDSADGTPFSPEHLSTFQMSKLANDKHKKLGDTQMPIPPQEDGLTVEHSASSTGSTEETVFNSAIRLQAGERAAYLAGACGDDLQLRQRVEALLRAHEEAQCVAPEQAGPGSGAPHEPGGQAGSPPALVELTEHSGDRIGRYKLLQQIGEGGMGVVYMAEQQEPVIRKVALKIVKLGMDSRQVVARFEAERQALALMDHPNIAKILDAGTAKTGRPFFVMELVRGIKITDYCDQNNVPTEDRLRLFIEVCQAIRHAHQKGIIHRDIKPSNILVTLHEDVPVPKVIDFGIAKATQGRLTDKTLFTEFHQFIGTPAYMSPEQAELSALDIDTRSDIYSLGVLLYELLTSNTPFDTQTLLRAGLDEMRRIIREDEPPKPSTRLGTLAAEKLSVLAKKRKSTPHALSKLVRGDLDWIVMTALEKDRTRRYGSANAFAQDVQRYLDQEPVSAGAATAFYKIRKFARHNKRAFALLIGIPMTVVLLAGAISSSLLMVRARKAEEVATREARRVAHAQVIGRTEARRAALAEKIATKEASASQQIAQFFTDMLKAAQPSVALGRDTKLLRDILNNTVERIGKDLKAQPELEARLRTTVGQVFTDLGEYENARGMFSEALDLRRKLFPKENADVATSLLNLAYVLRIQHKLSEAEDNCVQALAMRKKLFGDEHVDVATALWHLAHVLGDQGQLVRAEELHGQALAMRRKLLGDQDKDVASSLAGLADVLLSSPEKQGDAATMYRQALDIRIKYFGTPHPAVAASLAGVAKVFEAQGDLPKAESTYKDALAMRRKLFVNEHPDVARSLHNLAMVLAAQGKGKLPEAEKCYSEALAIRRKLLSSDPSEVAGSLAGLASVLQRQGKLDEAEKVLNEYLTAGVESETRSAGLMRSRGNLRARTGRWKEAAEDLSKAVRLDPKQTWTWIWFQLAPVLIESRDLAGYDQHRAAMLARFGATADPRIAERTAKACLLLPMTGEDLATASGMADTAVTTVEDRQLAFSQLVKGLAEYRQGRFTSALDWTQKALAKAGNDDQRDAQCHAVLAIAHHQLNQTNEARIALSKAVEIIETKPPKLESGDLTDEWPHWLISQILLREAKTLIGAASAVSVPVK